MSQDRSDDAAADEDGGERDGGDEKMTQDERWMARYNELKNFIENNKRNPSHHFYEERNMHSWVRHNRKLMNKGEMSPERVDRFKELLEMGEKYKHVNQYM